MEKTEFKTTAENVTKAMEVKHEGEWCLVVDYWQKPIHSICITMIAPNGENFVAQYDNKAKLMVRYH